MKIYNKIGIVLFFAVSLFMQGCKERYITYNDKEYVMFADTTQLYVVREDLLSYDLPIVSTVARPYDRNYAVEVLDASSTAVEGRDYTLDSYNFTIKAGELTSHVRINGLFDKLGTESQPAITFRLVMPKELVMPLYGDKTTVRMQKTNKFKRENFTGWAMVSSMFLYEFSLTGSYQRLIHTSADPTDDHAVILENFLADGYNVKIVFDDDTDPAAPRVYTPQDQVLSSEDIVFGTIHGDNHILIGDSTQGASYFLGHANIAVLINRMYVQNIGEDVGTVGNFVSEIDWVSDEEAERLRREDGM